MKVPVEKDHLPLHIVTNSVILECDGKFLIIRRRPDEVAFPGKWEFVGGKLENGESLREGLKRETKEETGLELEENISFLRDYEFTRRDGHHVVGLVFVARAGKGKVKLCQDHTEYAWISPGEASKYDLIEGLGKELKQAAEMLGKK
jgi:mutator protein MutT